MDKNKIVNGWEFVANAEPQGSSDGFWYDLIDGGYIKPGEVLARQDQLDDLIAAIKVVSSFEKALEEAELLNEF